MLRSCGYFSEPPILDETTEFYALPYEATKLSLGLILSKGKGNLFLTSDGLILLKTNNEFCRLCVGNSC